MAVAANICVAWPSTAASIPSGWSRETSLDSRYILGAGSGADTDLTTDRGASSHIHTSPSHTPIQDSHTHDVSTVVGTGTVIVSGTVAGSASDPNHTHPAVTSNAELGVNNGVAITVDATSNELAYTEVIWIKSNGTPAFLPAGCYAFFESDSLPSGWSRVKVDRYLKGAVGTNPAADGGSNTHSHTSPAHTHTQNAHNHGTLTSAPGDTGLVGRGAGADTPSSVGHTHSLTVNSTSATNQSTTTTIDAGDSEPPFTKVNIVEASSPSLPDNIICLWLGTNAAIPANWTRYTPLDSRWLKGANLGEFGTTGGGTQHSHNASDCQPIQDSHTHTITDNGATSSSSEPGAANTFSAGGHQHSPWDVTTVTATNQAATVTINNCSVDAALPKHRTVIYVYFTSTIPPVTPSRVPSSYTTGLFFIGGPEAEIRPEVAKRIAQGDLRFIPNRN